MTKLITRLWLNDLNRYFEIQNGKGEKTCFDVECDNMVKPPKKQNAEVKLGLDFNGTIISLS